MIKSLYSGVSGMRNHQTRMDIIGNNIANVNTTAYKSGRVNFVDILSQTIKENSQVGRGMTVGSIDNIFTQGSLMTTGRDTDLFIQGNGFFKLVDDSGDEEKYYYTRDGSFYVKTIDGENYLVNSSGYKVVFENENTPGLGAKIDGISIGKDGTVTVIVDGKENDIGKIGLVQINPPEQLLKEGDNLYSLPADKEEDLEIKVPGQEGLGLIVSQNLEMSNVDLTNEFTNMIVTQRGYQANARVITTSDEMLQEIMGLKR